MKRMILILLTLTALSLTGIGAEAPWTTDSMLNGRGWNKASREEKVGFVMGTHDGLVTGVLAADKDKDSGETMKSTLKTFHGKSSYGETVAGLDDFYRDPANLQIPVLLGMEYFQFKVKGATPEELAAKLADLRKYAASAPDDSVK